MAQKSMIELNVDDAAALRMFASARLKMDPLLRSELESLGHVVEETIRATAPRGANHRGRGKRLADSFRTRTYGKSVVVRSYKSYGPLIEHGGHTRPHDIKPRKTGGLAFAGVVRKLVHHPGGSYAGKHFAAAAAETHAGRIEEGIAAAVMRSFE